MRSFLYLKYMKRLVSEFKFFHKYLFRRTDKKRYITSRPRFSFSPIYLTKTDDFTAWIRYVIKNLSISMKMHNAHCTQVGADEGVKILPKKQTNLSEEKVEPPQEKWKKKKNVCIKALFICVKNWNKNRVSSTFILFICSLMLTVFIPDAKILYWIFLVGINSLHYFPTLSCCHIQRSLCLHRQKLLKPESFLHNGC